MCVYSGLRVGDDGWPGRVRHKAVNRDKRHDGISPDQVLEEEKIICSTLIPKYLAPLLGVRGRVVVSQEAGSK